MNEHPDHHDHTPTPPEPGQPVLSPADARALDALIEAGLDAARVNPGAERARVRKVSSLLNLLAVRSSRDSALVDVTLARILQTEGLGAGIADEAMVFDDEAALDAWVMNGYQSDRVPGSLRERARRHERLASMVTRVEGVAGDSESLVERTLARVQDSIDSEEVGMRIETERMRLGSGIRLADLISVAAVLLIAAAVVWPVVNNIRDKSRQYACLGNMGSSARAFGSYALSNRDSLPVVNASLGGGTWWNVGDHKSRSNSANLFQLTKSGYARLADLACPGNPSAPTGEVRPDATDWRNLDEVSYSYRIMFGEQQPRWQPTADNRVVIMSDRSPVVLKSIRGEPVSPLADSMNHRSQGQHILFSDGSAKFYDTPVLENGDNIWLPRFIERKIGELTGKPLPPPLNGQETPDGMDDAFVGP